LQLYKHSTQVAGQSTKAHLGPTGSVTFSWLLTTVVDDAGVSFIDEIEKVLGGVIAIWRNSDGILSKVGIILCKSLVGQDAATASFTNSTNDTLISSSASVYGLSRTITSFSCSSVPYLLVTVLQEITSLKKIHANQYIQAIG
jgi:hypothetical protein